MKTLTAFAYEEFSAKTLRIDKSSLTLTMKTLTLFAYEAFSAKTLRINKSSLTLTMKTLISFAYEVFSTKILRINSKCRRLFMLLSFWETTNHNCIWVLITLKLCRKTVSSVLVSCTEKPIISGYMLWTEVIS